MTLEEALARDKGSRGLEKYELIEEIGHGAMATVFRARDPRLGREVAIKLIHKHLRENPEVATRFVSEARAAASLRHPGIVEVYDVSDEEDEERFLVVELLRGTTLRKILQQHRDMPAEIGACIVLGLCDALEHAHQSGIVHRDVKPENVLVETPHDRSSLRVSQVDFSDSDVADVILNESPRVPEKRLSKADQIVSIKLTDFGIAKVLDAQGVTSTGQVLGSPAHMAPEQIEGGEVDPRTDVFALGVLFYECIVGKLPFDGKNPAQVLKKVLEGTYIPADRARPSVGGRWAKILASALARDMKSRTPSAHALFEAIHQELESLGISDPEGEILSYFRDPKNYSIELIKRLVPRLLARAEIARKQGDIECAADDLNRAAALCPNDVSIVRRLASLNAAKSRRQWIARGSYALGLCIVSTMTSYSVVRVLKASPQTAIGQNPVASNSATDTFVVTSQLPVSTSNTTSLPTTTTTTQTSSSSSTALQTNTTSAITTEVPRRVRFSLIPKGASLVLDGQHVSWFGHTFELLPGSHTVDISVPNSKCCKALTTVASIVPAPIDDPENSQTVVFKLETLPATVTLMGAPAQGQYTCPALNLSGFSGQSKQITLSDVEWSGLCEFTASSGATRSVSANLKAGEVNTLSWPVDLR